VLRLVQSGIPATPDWDDFYEDTGRGGKIFLAGLRHYVERHFGQPCENMDHEGKIPRSKAESAIHVIHPT